MRSLSSLVLILCTTACAAPRIDLDAWRASEAAPRAADARGSLADDSGRVDDLRAAHDLEASRTLALALAAENPEHGATLLRASRAESDGVLLFPDDEDARNHAAASALDYAERAFDAGERSAPARGQFAWALGTTTHLQSMGDRSGHAARTQEVAEAALERDPEEPTALATLALLNLRLETLPWIARVMARSRPDSSLEAAERFARRAVEARPSYESFLILAKVLAADDRPEEAREVIGVALRRSFAHPRDRVLEGDLRALADELD